MKYILLLLLSTQAQADYVWAQEEPPSKVYRWHQVSSMADVGMPTTLKARTVQYPEGLCVVYSTLSLKEAQWRINSRDDYTVADHEIYFHCRGKYHPEKEGARK